ncbi:MAG: InlB B-repeat-containing protein [Acetobacter sp.]|nr:InlB B-repeat-containing protein [Bacteroides sp.]MCM1340110.1 InlB B-repeat-containing protein [Acetobacter sp.]MCM1432693.1 InlB B-repeat-containing protein [Clostridiales bacterium]
MKKTKKLLSVFLVLVMLFSVLPAGTMTANAATLTISQLKAKFPQGKYWNHVGSSSNNENGYTSTPCPSHSSTSTCNAYTYGGTKIGWQCFGFACKLGYDAYGSNPKNWGRAYNLDNIKPGDIINYNGSNPGHTVFVTGVSGNTVYFAECNYGGRCLIRWDRSLKKSEFNNLYNVYVAPYALSGGGAHVHSYSGSYYEAAHPHKVYQKCSCGGTKYTGAYKTVSSCSQCTMTVDSKYNTVKGFKAYPCVSSKFEVKTSDLTTRGGEIYTTDFCTINEVYTNGWCKVTFPMDTGGTRTAYTKISNFIKSPSTSLTKYTATSYINLYSTSSMSTQIYRIYPGDVCYTIGTSGSATQIFMPMSSGGYYVLGWAVLPPAQQSSGYDVPFKCRTISTEKVKCYNDVNFTSSPGYIYPTDDCVITAVYSNGKVQVSCPWSDGTTKTVYVNKSVFINSSTTPQNTTAPKYAKTYLRTDMSTNIGWIDSGNKIQIVATSGNKTQIIYPADVGKRCAWVNTSDLTQTYTVTYNANGGNGAPSAQTKNHGANLTLSSTKPTRTGYTFVGWGETASATSAAYSAGSIYSNNKNITLYAVWRKQAYTITYNANSGENAPGVQSQTYGESVTVTNEKPTKTYTVKFNANGGTVDTQYYSFNCEFIGWNTKADGTGTTIKSGSSYTPNANVTLYAVYNNPTFESYPIPSREGYTFNGWYTASSGGTKLDITSAISADTSLYAQWEKEIYSVIYYAEGASNVSDDQEKTNGVDLILSDQIPLKSGYIFKGWTLDSETNTIDYLPGAKYTRDESVVLYAVWEKDEVAVNSIAIASKPTKLTYELGEQFEQSGLKLKLNYSDGTTEIIADGFTVSSPDMSSAGTKTVTVSYDEKSTTFKITVNNFKPIENLPVIRFESKSARVGETITLNVAVENNPGFSTASVKFIYDETKLQLIEAKLSDEFASGSNVSYDNLPYLTFVKSSDINSDIKMMTLTFKILDTAEAGDAYISLEYSEGDISNSNEQDVNFSVIDGNISIVNYIPGDINDDGKVNTKDLTRLLKYINHEDVECNELALDVNGDGKVNTKDLTRLLKYINHEDVEIF